VRLWWRCKKENDDITWWIESEEEDDVCRPDALLLLDPSCVNLAI
jgi:hypothetical protein